MDRVHDVGPAGDAADGKPAAEPLCGGDQVGNYAEVLRGEHCAGTGHARLHLVSDEDDPVLFAVLGQAGKKAITWDDHACLALYRLDEHAGDPVCSDLLVHRVDRQVRTSITTQLRWRPCDAAVGIAEGNAVDLRGKGTETRLVR